MLYINHVSIKEKNNIFLIFKKIFKIKIKLYLVKKKKILGIQEDSSNEYEGVFVLFSEFFFSVISLRVKLELNFAINIRVGRARGQPKFCHWFKSLLLSLSFLFCKMGLWQSCPNEKWTQ